MWYMFKANMALQLVHCHVKLHQQVDYWVDYSAASIVTGSNLENVLVSINEYLALRTYFIGYSLSLADVAVWGQLQGKPGT